LGLEHLELEKKQNETNKPRSLHGNRERNPAVKSIGSVVAIHKSGLWELYWRIERKKSGRQQRNYILTQYIVTKPKSSKQNGKWASGQ
jgi:hypothetical protein